METSLLTRKLKRELQTSLTVSSPTTEDLLCKYKIQASLFLLEWSESEV